MKSVARDGVKLAYAEAGTGSKSMLLVHCMQCDHTHALAEATAMPSGLADSPGHARC